MRRMARIPPTGALGRDLLGGPIVQHCTAICLPSVQGASEAERLETFDVVSIPTVSQSVG